MYPKYVGIFYAHIFTYLPTYVSIYLFQNSINMPHGNFVSCHVSKFPLSKYYYENVEI
jgi:hypothetical protein